MRFLLVGAILCLWSCSAPNDEKQVSAASGLNSDTPRAESSAGEGAADAFLSKEEEKGRQVTLYYRHPKLEAAVPEIRNIFENPNPAEEMKQVIELLSIAPGNELLPIWPENTYLRELYLLKNGTVVVDFHSAFVDSVGAGAMAETFMVYSLVNTILVNFTDFKRVRILVDGQVRETLLGHVDIEFPIMAGNYLYTIVPEVRPEDEIESRELPPPTAVVKDAK